MKLFNLLLITLLSIATALCSHATTSNQTQGVKRYAVIAGANSGGSERIKLQYADDDAKSISDVFTSLGGLENKNNTLLLEPTSSELIEAIDSVKEKIQIDQESNTSNVKPRVEFIFYYSGHSDEKNLLLGEQTLAYSTLREHLNSVQADVRVAILDSCASGAFTRLKGGQQVKPFLENETSQVEGYAYLASSSADEAAQESDAIGGAYFTHYLVSALRGAADLSKDKKVTLDEAYQYAFNETLARTQGSVHGAQHAAYDIQLSGESSLILTNLEKTSANLLLDENIVGRIYIRDSQGKLKVELNKRNIEPLNIGIEEGEYQITVEQESKVFQVQNYSIVKGITVLKMQDLNEIDPTYSVARGASVDNDIEELTYKLSIIPSMQTPPNLNNKKQRVKFDINLFGNKTYQIDGLSAGAIFNHIEDSTNGILVSGVFNYNVGNFKGVSSSGVANFHTGEKNSGAMLAGVLNYSQYDFHGFMGAGTTNISQGQTNGWLFSGVNNILLSKNTIFSDKPIESNYFSKGVLASGVANIVMHNFSGVQLTGVANVNFKDTKGLMASGVVNIANNIEGHQIGLVNVARKMDGYAFGLVNVIGDGIMDLSLSYNEFDMLMVGFKSGSKKSFSQWSVGKHSTKDVYQIGFGLGLHHSITNQIALENSINVNTFFDEMTCIVCTDISDYDNINEDVVASYQGKVGFAVMKNLKPFVGVSINKLINSDSIHNEVIKNKLEIEDNQSKTWIGFNVGVDF